MRANLLSLLTYCCHSHRLHCWYGSTIKNAKLRLSDGSSSEVWRSGRITGGNFRAPSGIWARLEVHLVALIIVMVMAVAPTTPVITTPTATITPATTTPVITTPTA